MGRRKPKPEQRVKECFTKDCIIDRTCLNCPFYKSPDAYKKQLETVNARLRTLDKVQQTYIAEKYYKGVKVWKPNKEN